MPETPAVDRELCLGSGMCLVYAPGTFAHDAESKAIVVDPDGDSPGDLRAAVDACPMSAISLPSHD